MSVTAGKPLVNRPIEYGDGGAGLLFADIRITLLMLNEMRYAAVNRLFGVARDDSVLVSIIAAGLLAQAVRGKAVGAITAGPRPSRGDSMLGISMLRESAHWLAGDLYRDTPIFGTLIALGFLGAAVRPVVSGSFRGIRVATHDARAGFDHRYGHLLGRHRHRLMGTTA